MNLRPHLWAGILLSLSLLGLAWMGLPVGQASTARAQLPPRPTLPPTPIPATATPTTTPTTAPTTAPSSTPTALPIVQPVRIRLVVDAQHEGAWSLVQWQGGDRVWHDVTDWLGQIERGQVQWRVLPKDYDTGPFRWIILDRPNGKILAVSAPFTLPNERDPLTVISVGKR